MPELKQRPLGATATLGHSGFPHIVSQTGGELDIVTGPSQAGFNPLDLLHASLAACLAMSARIAAREMGLLDEMGDVSVTVTGEKAKEGPSRIETFNAAMTFAGRLTDEQKSMLAHRAEEVCTVSNTLSIKPVITITSG